MRPLLHGDSGGTILVASWVEYFHPECGRFTWEHEDRVRAGVKLPVTVRGMLIVGVQYLVLTMDPQGATSRNGSDELSVMLGFGVWF